MCGNRRIDWKVRATPRATIALGRRPTRLAPSNVMLPPSGRMSPVTTLKNVVLPAPLGPIRPMMAARGTSRSTSFTATMALEAPGEPAHLEERRAGGRPGAPLAQPRGNRLRARRWRDGLGRERVVLVANDQHALAPSGQALGPQQHDEDQPSPKKNQRQSVRSIVASSGRPVARPSARTRNVDCESTTRSKTVMSMPPRITPRRLPAPPRTTMQSSMIETWNSKAPGVMACSLAA